MSLLEQQSEQGHIDLFYGDETAVSELGYVPYGWQFSDEDVYIPSQRGESRNYTSTILRQAQHTGSAHRFGLLSRNNQFFYKGFTHSITSQDVIEYLDCFMTGRPNPTVVVLDNASIHTSKKFKQCLKAWQQRNLYVFHLPTYSPHLNIIERFWKELKEGWLRPQDYTTADSLFYAVSQIFAAVGRGIGLNFSPFSAKK